MRSSGRQANQLREIKLTRQYTKHAEGSVLVEFGDTKVICNASLVNGVPRFLKGTGQGWLTAEYGMLPRSTNERMDREASKGKQSGRTQEIQRLIGRALRTCIDLKSIGENTIAIDCDVIQADGGTRTASITGACIAVYDAIKKLPIKKSAQRSPFRQFVASVSVGVVNGKTVLDLDYVEDSNAETDMNVVMSDQGHFIEIQGTAEANPFSPEQLEDMLDLAKHGITQLLSLQRDAIG